IARLDAARVVVHAGHPHPRGGLVAERRARDLAHELAQRQGTRGGGGRGGGGRGGRGRHDAGSKTSLTVDPLGRPVPAGGSWRERRPVPSTVGVRPSPMAVFTASRWGKPVKSGTRASPGRIGAEGVTTPARGSGALFPAASPITW